MSDVDWYGDTPDENVGGADGGGASGTSPGGGVPVPGYPDLYAGDTVNGQGALGIWRDPNVPAAGSPATQPDPVNIDDWVRRLGDQGIASQMVDGRLSIFERPEIIGRDQTGYNAVGIDDYVPGQQNGQPSNWKRYAPSGIDQDLRKPVYQDLDAYNRANSYLNRDPASAALGQAVQGANIPTVMIPDDQDRFDPNQGAHGVIYWNPSRGLQLTPTSNSNGPISPSSPSSMQSPALLLDHERGHADQWLSDPIGFLINAPTPTGDDYDYAEETRNIQDVEAPAALRLGEPTRTNHRGTYLDYLWPYSQAPLWPQK